MAIWRHLLRPLLPWLWRILAAVVASLVIAWVAGTVLIARREVDPGGLLPANIPGRMIVAGGRQVHVVEAGQGEPVLLVHGFAGSTFAWEEAVLPALAASYHTIAVDLLGMGFSARPSDLAYGYEAWSRQIVDVMDALALPRAALVGHALGGAITAIVAGDHPDRVSKLVLVAPLVPLEQAERPWFFKLLEIPGVGEMMLGTTDHLPNLPGFSETYQSRARRIFRLRGTREALLTYVRHGRDSPRLVAAYRTIEAPTLVVAGTADDIVPYAAVKRWAPAIHDALVLPVSGAGHWLMRDEPTRVSAAIADFISGER